VYHADLLEQKNNAMVWEEIFLALESNISGNGVLRNMTQPHGKPTPTSGRRGDFLDVTCIACVFDVSNTRYDKRLGIKASCFLQDTGPMISVSQ
jgi:hypothetical protein